MASMLYKHPTVLYYSFNHNKKLRLSKNHINPQLFLCKSYSFVASGKKQRTTQTFFQHDCSWKIKMWKWGNQFGVGLWGHCGASNKQYHLWWKKLEFGFHFSFLELYGFKYTLNCNNVLMIWEGGLGCPWLYLVNSHVLDPVIIIGIAATLLIIICLICL